MRVAYLGAYLGTADICKANIKHKYLDPISCDNSLAICMENISFLGFLLKSPVVSLPPTQESKTMSV